MSDTMSDTVSDGSATVHPSPHEGMVSTRAADACAAHSLPRLGEGLRIRHGALRRGGGGRRAGRTVLGEGTLRAPAGAVVALVGENGAGKSTLLMTAAGVILGDTARSAAARGAAARGAAARGAATTVTLDGREVREVAYLPQRPTLPPWLPVRRAAELHGADGSLLEDVIGRLGMTSLLDRRADELSGGQLQALVAAIVLVRPEPVVLLDEPFTAVDLARRPILRQLVAERAARVPRGVVVLSSHVAADLAALCDWLVVLRDGGYAYQGAAWALAHGVEEGGASAHARGADGNGGGTTGRPRLDADALERAVTALLAPLARPGAAGHSPL